MQADLESIVSVCGEKKSSDKAMEHSTHAINDENALQ